MNIKKRVKIGRCRRKERDKGKVKGEEKGKVRIGLLCCDAEEGK